MWHFKCTLTKILYYCNIYCNLLISFLWQRLQQENKSLSDENKTVSEKLNAAPAENGISHGPSIEEHEKM